MLQQLRGASQRHEGDESGGQPFSLSLLTFTRTESSFIGGLQQRKWSRAAVSVVSSQVMRPRRRKRGYQSFYPPAARSTQQGDMFKSNSSNNVFREVSGPGEDPLHIFPLKRPPVVQRSSNCPPHYIMCSARIRHGKPWKHGNISLRCLFKLNTQVKQRHQSPPAESLSLSGWIQETSDTDSCYRSKLCIYPPLKCANETVKTLEQWMAIRNNYYSIASKSFSFSFELKV